MQQLNFPLYTFRFKNSENKTLIYDEIRKKFVVLQPEEWVRQNCIQYLIKKKGYPKSLISIEKEIKINTLSKRYDIVVYNTDGSIQIIVECKSSKIDIDQTTLDQIARYNMVLNANYLMVTNGINHYYCLMDLEEKRYHFIKELPEYIR